MTAIAFMIFAVIMIGLSIWAAMRNRADRLKRAAYVRGYAFPKLLRDKCRQRYPQLTDDRVDLVFRGLRQFFQIAALRGGIRAPSLGMPSKAVDEVWHDFILMSREYTTFCNRAFGGYFHHAPEAAMTSPMPRALGNTLSTIDRFDAVKMGWHALSGVPLLFAVDAAIGLRDGYVHTAESIASLRRQHALSGASACTGGSCASPGDSCGDGGGCDSGGCGGGGCSS